MTSFFFACLHGVADEANLVSRMKQAVLARALPQNLGATICTAGCGTMVPSLREEEEDFDWTGTLQRSSCMNMIYYV